MAEALDGARQRAQPAAQLLSDQVVGVILARLPGNDALAARGVCRQWRRAYDEAGKPMVVTWGRGERVGDLERMLMRAPCTREVTLAVSGGEAEGGEAELPAGLRARVSELTIRPAGAAASLRPSDPHSLVSGLVRDCERVATLRLLPGHGQSAWPLQDSRRLLLNSGCLARLQLLDLHVDAAAQRAGTDLSFLPAHVVLRLAMHGQPAAGGALRTGAARVERADVAVGAGGWEWEPAGAGLSALTSLSWLPLGGSNGGMPSAAPGQLREVLRAATSLQRLRIRGDVSNRISFFDLPWAEVCGLHQLQELSVATYTTHGESRELVSAGGPRRRWAVPPLSVLLDLSEMGLLTALELESIVPSCTFGRYLLLVPPPHLRRLSLRRFSLHSPLPCHAAARPNAGEVQLGGGTARLFAGLLPAAGRQRCSRGERCAENAERVPASVEQLRLSECEWLGLCIVPASVSHLELERIGSIEQHFGARIRFPTSGCLSSLTVRGALEPPEPPPESGADRQGRGLLPGTLISARWVGCPAPLVQGWVAQLPSSLQQLRIEAQPKAPAALWDLSHLTALTSLHLSAIMPAHRRSVPSAPVQVRLPHAARLQTLLVCCEPLHPAPDAPPYSSLQLGAAAESDVRLAVQVLHLQHLLQPPRASPRRVVSPRTAADVLRAPQLLQTNTLRLHACLGGLLGCVRVERMAVPPYVDSEGMALLASVAATLTCSVCRSLIGCKQRCRHCTLGFPG